MYINNLPVYDEKNCVFFALGRNAMYAACLAVGLKNTDEILTPAFDCDGSLQPFRVLGYALRLYRSDPHTFSADIKDIERQITSKTKLIHIINHFGLPQPWEELLQLKEKTDIPILEDNAYSLFSKIADKPFGTFGDVSVFSLRKNLPLIDGGLLLINNPRYSLKLKFKKQPLLPWEELRGFLRLFRTLPPPPLYSKGQSVPVWPLRDAIGRDFAIDYLRPISKLAKFQLNRFSAEDYEEICAQKRKFYLFLAKEISSLKGVKVLWPDLPEGVVPFCLSILLDENRDEYWEALRKRYAVMAWPTLSQAVIDQLDNFPEVKLLGTSLLQFNLLAEKVRRPGFSYYLEGLLKDMRNLSKKYNDKV